MVYVSIQLWPGGDKTRAKVLQEITIANDGNGTSELGTYDVQVGHCLLFKPDANLLNGNRWRIGRCQHQRNKSPAQLVLPRG